MTPRRPGYDIDGQPTKVDPRDFPDPLTVPEPEQDTGYRRTGCSIFAIALAVLLVLVAGCSAQPAGNATPSAAPESVRNSGSQPGVVVWAAQGQRGAPHSTGGYDAGSSPATDGGGAPPPTGTAPQSNPAFVSEPLAAPYQSAADVTYSGIVNYATPSHGRWYLAIPDGRGVAVTICGPGGCLDRVSTDAGPDLAMQRAGRIADLNSVDWLAISGVPLRYGGFQGTILIVKRPARIELPQTSTGGEP